MALTGEEGTAGAHGPRTHCATACFTLRLAHDAPDSNHSKPCRQSGWGRSEDTPREAAAAATACPNPAASAARRSVATKCTPPSVRYAPACGGAARLAGQVRVVHHWCRRPAALHEDQQLLDNLTSCYACARPDAHPAWWPSRGARQTRSTCFQGPGLHGERGWAGKRGSQIAPSAAARHAAGFMRRSCTTCHLAS